MLLVRGEQILLQSLEVYLIYLIALRFFSRRQALAAGVIAAFYPELVSYGYLIFSEILFLAFFLGSALFYFRSLKKPGYQSLRWLIPAGILSGLACLTRSVNLLFLPLLLLHLLWFRKDGLKDRMALALIFLLAIFAPISIQTAKNYRLAACPLLIDTCAGLNFYKSHNQEAPPHYDFNEYHRPEKFSRERCAGNEVCGRIRCEFGNARAFIFAHPGLTLRRMGVKVIDLYTPNLFIYKNIFRESSYLLITPEPPGETEKLSRYRGLWFRILGSGAYLALMLLALLGISASKDRELKSFTVLLILYHTAICSLFFSVSRYRMPFIPFLIIYAGAFLAMSKEDLRDLAKRQWALGLGLWLLLFILTFPRLLLILK